MTTETRALANRVRKGDLVVEQRSHSSLNQRFERTEWTTFHVARVAAAAADGRVKRVSYEDDGPSYESHPSMILVPDTDAKRNALKKIYGARQEFRTLDDLRAAMLASL